MMEVHAATRSHGLVKYLAKCLIEFAKQIESLQYRKKSVISNENVEIIKSDDEGYGIQNLQDDLNISYEYVADTGIIFPQILRLRNRIVKLLTLCTEQNIYVDYDPSETHNILYSNLNNNARTIIVNYLTILMIDFVEYIIIATDFFKREKPQHTASEIKMKFCTIYKTLKNLPLLPEIKKINNTFEKSLNNFQFCSELLNRLLVLNKYISKFHRAYLKSISNTDSASADDKISIISSEERVKKRLVNVCNNSFKLPEFFENTRVKNIARQSIDTIEIVDDAQKNLIYLGNKKQYGLDSDNLKNRELITEKSEDVNTTNSQNEDKEYIKKKKNTFSESENSNIKKNNSDNKHNTEMHTENFPVTKKRNISEVEDEIKKKRKRENSISDIVDKKTEKFSKRNKFKSNEFINTSLESHDEVSDELEILPTNKTQEIFEKNYHKEEKQHKKEKKRKKELYSDESDTKQETKSAKISKRRISERISLNKINSNLYSHDSEENQAEERIESTKKNCEEAKQRKKEKSRKKELHSVDNTKQEIADKRNEEVKPAKITKRRITERIVLNKNNTNLDSDKSEVETNEIIENKENYYKRKKERKKEKSRKRELYSNESNTQEKQDKTDEDTKPVKISKRRISKRSAENKSHINSDSDYSEEKKQSKKDKNKKQETEDKMDGAEREKNTVNKSYMDSDSDEYEEKKLIKKKTNKKQETEHTVDGAKRAKLSKRRITINKSNINSDSNDSKEEKQTKKDKNNKEETDDKTDKPTKISKRRISESAAPSKRSIDSESDKDTVSSKKKKRTWKEKKIMNELVTNVKNDVYKNPASETIDSVDVLSAIESGDIQVDYKAAELDDLINTIKLHDLTDNERFLYIQEFVAEAGEQKILTDDIKEKLKTLYIDVNWDIPPAHQIAARLSAIPTEEEREELKKMGIAYGGKFTEAETNIIKKNWMKFSKIYEFPDPKPFLSFYHEGNKAALQFSQRKKFVQFLGQGLPHKVLYSIYKRFKTIYTKQKIKVGRFSPEEDLLIMSYINKLKLHDHRNKFSKLAPVLNRNRAQVERRYKVIQNEPVIKVTWTLERLQILIQHLLDEINSENINDLRDFPFDHPAFIYAAQQMEMNPNQLKFHFVFHLASRLFSQAPLLTNIMKVQIIERLIERKERDWKEINWKSLAEEYEGVAPQFLWYLMKTTLRHVPRKHQEDLKFCLRYLKEYYIPNLKNNRLYELRHLTRLKWVKGKLEEYL